MGCWFIQVSLIAFVLAAPGCLCTGDFGPNEDYVEGFEFDSQEATYGSPQMHLVLQERDFSDEQFEDPRSGEINTEFSSRRGLSAEEEFLDESNENARGIFAYKTKSKRVFKTVPYGHGPPNHHHRGPPIRPFHHVPKPAPFIHGHYPPYHRPPPKMKHKVPHYVKYWKQNKGHHDHDHIPKHHKHIKPPKHGWKMVKDKSPLSRDYLIDLAERLADGIGLIPEYGNHESHHDKHGKHKYKGITLHNGFFTEVL